MTITIDGTSGIASVDGSAGSPSVRGSDANSGILYSSDAIKFSTGGTERFAIDSSGNLQSGASNLLINGSSLGAISFKAPDGGSRYYFGEMGNSANAQLSMYNSSDQQKLRISATNGPGGDATFFQSDIALGTTTVSGGASSGRFCIEYEGSNANAIKSRNTTSNNGNAMVMITASTEVGSIVQGTSSTAYNTSSDYRLKENQVAISDGIARLKTLKPYRFNWKVDPDTKVDGFFAHEVTAVPEAIKGTKDAVATEDNENLNIKKDDPIYQQIDQSKLVPLLTAALQEAITKIETLETKVAALEAA
jgi:hypothetical protein